MKKSELKTIIYDYVGNLEKTKEELEDKKQEKDLYISLLDTLNKDNYNQVYEDINLASILINIIFGNENKISNKLFDIVFRLKEIENICEETAIEEKEYQINVKKFNSLINFFQQQYKELVEKEKELDEKYTLDKLKSSRKLLSKLKYSQKITENEIESLHNILIESNISIEDSILAIEVVRKHNKLLKNKIEKGQFVCKTKIEMMLDTEVEEFKDCYIEDATERKECQIVIDLYKSLINDVENDQEIKELIDKPSEEENPNVEKFQYIMKSLLNYYREQMMEIKEMIYDKDCYFDEGLKDEITTEFNKIRNKWKKIKYVYSAEMLKLDKINLKDMTLPTVNNILYAKTKNNKIYIMDDITKISEENLLKVKILLNKLRTNTLSGNESKALIENKKLKGYRELRKDQIRIVYLHLGNNNCLIIGVGTKKADNDLNFYNKMVEREASLKIEDYAKEADKITEKINSYVKKNQRKGSR